MTRILVALSFVLAAGAAHACPASQPPRAAAQAIADPIDQALFSRTVVAEVNRIRCARGLASLQLSAGITRAAAGHSATMAEIGQMIHTSPAPGRRTVGARFRAENVRYGRASENVGYLPACGQSYAGLARQMVQMWAGSPPHARNILDPGVARTGAGAASQGGCDRVYMTNAFAG